MKTRTGPEEALRCSFCHKYQDAVAKLISSPSDYPRAYICDECVAVCNSILEDDRGDAHPATTAGHLPKPQEVKNFLAAVQNAVTERCSEFGQFSVVHRFRAAYFPCGCIEQLLDFCEIPRSCS